MLGGGQGGCDCRCMVICRNGYIPFPYMGIVYLICSDGILPLKVRICCKYEWESDMYGTALGIGPHVD